eukprot:127444-Pyramimonas_sp.AAC.1
MAPACGGVRGDRQLARAFHHSYAFPVSGNNVHPPCTTADCSSPVSHRLHVLVCNRVDGKGNCVDVKSNRVDIKGKCVDVKGKRVD